MECSQRTNSKQKAGDSIAGKIRGYVDKAIIKFNVLTLMIALFLVTMLLVLFGAHWLVYFSLTRFFSMTGAAERYWLMFGLAVLAVSFFSSSALAHFANNWATRSFYFASSTWLGILTNLVLTFGMAWIVIIIGKSLAFQISLPFLGRSAMLLAVLLSGWGMWNAFHPQIKRIEVTIPNLPEAWKGRHIVQLSDVHIGHVHGQEFLQKVVSMTNELQPDAVMITGDLFDGMDGQLNSLTGPLINLTAPHGVYFITGNHETYLGVKKTLAVLEQYPQIQILQDRLIREDGLQIIGLDYPERGSTKNVEASLAGISDFSKTEPSILLHHSPTGMDEAKQNGVGLQLSGHTHRGQLFPFNFITALIYHGYDAGLHQQEGFSEYTSVGVGTWGPPMRTSSRPEITLIELH